MVFDSSFFDLYCAREFGLQVQLGIDSEEQVGESTEIARKGATS